MTEKEAYVVVYSRKGAYRILGIYESYKDARERLESEVEEIYDEPERLKDSEDYYSTPELKDRWWISSGEFHPSEDDNPDNKDLILKSDIDYWYNSIE